MENPRICPRCNKPILPGDKEWYTAEGLVHDYCVPKETRERVLKSLAKVDAEIARLPVSPGFSKPKVKLGNIVLAKPEDFDDTPWACRKCRDTGWCDTKPDAKGYTRAYECVCAKKKRAEARVRALESRYKVFAGLSFETYKPTHHTQKAALKVCRAYVKKWPLVDGRGLLLWGPPGTGKTCLLKCVAVELAKRWSTEVMWLRATEIALRLRGSFDKESDESENRLVKDIGAAELMILDDLGSENISPYNKSVFFEMLGRRHDHMGPTFITTNLGENTTEQPGPDGRLQLLPSLEARMGRPLFSRLNEMCDFVFVNGKDRRMRK